jgi:hypothetical protein
MPKNSASARRAKSRDIEPPASVDYVREHYTRNGAFKLKPAAEYIGGVSVPTMHRLVARGLLRPNRSTRHLIFLRSELDRFLRDGMT